VKILAIVTAFVLMSLPVIARYREAPSAPLDRTGRAIILALAGVFLTFFTVTVERAAFNQARTGDVGVYLRAAWAARKGTSIYQITDQHGWHYLYPPLLASLLVPLADPPEDAPTYSKAGTIPYWVSVGIWYFISIGCLLVSIHMVASALEDYETTRSTPPSPAYSQGWWSLRLLPLLLTLFFALDGLNRGQSTFILLLCLSASGASILRGRSVRAGLWVGTAAAIKLFPAYLLVYGVWRRDQRFLGGAAAAIAIGFLVPVAVMGPSASFTAYREFFYERLLGEALGNGDATVARELHGTNSRIQSFEYMIYNTFHPDREVRAAEPPAGYFLVHIGLSLLLTSGILWVMRRPGDRLAEFLFFAALVQLVVPILPVSRPHYYVFGILVLAGLYAAEWSRRRGLRWPIAFVALAYLAASILDEDTRTWALDFGFATYAALALGGLALWAVRRQLDVVVAPSETDG